MPTDGGRKDSRQSPPATRLVFYTLFLEEYRILERLIWST